MSIFLKRLFSPQLLGCFIFLGLFFAYLFYIHEKNIVSMHFVDEEDNFLVGWYVLQGQKIYGDLFSHHQPLTYLFSTILQFVTQPNSIFLLVKRHREVMMLWMLVWDILLLWRFQYKAVPFVILFEISKNLLFGNLFLAESLVVYPLVYLTFFLFISEKKWYRVETLFLGLCAALIVLQLSPLWPLVAFFCVLLFWKEKKQWRYWVLWFVIGFLPLIFITVRFISLADYMHQTMYINTTYYIHMSSMMMGISFLKGLFSPILAFTQTPHTQLIWIIRAILLGFFVCIYFFIKAKRYIELLSMLLLLGLANIRFIQPGEEIYNGFHILPWFALLLCFFSFMSMTLFLKAVSVWAKIGWIVLLLSMVVISIVQNSVFLFPKGEVTRDLFINYSRTSDIGEAIHIMKRPKDTLFIRQIQPLIYWQARIDHASPMLFYYDWMHAVPELREAHERLFATDPLPTFVYCDCIEKNYAQLAVGTQKEKYQELKLDKKRSKLFVLKTRLHSLAQKQRDDLAFYRFGIQ